MRFVPVLFLICFYYGFSQQNSKNKFILDSLDIVGRQQLDQGRYISASKTFETAFQYIDAKDLRRKIDFNFLLINSYQSAVDHNSSKPYLKESQELISRLRDDSLQVILNHYKVNSAFFKGDVDEAMVLSYQNLELSNRLESTYLKSFIYGDLGLMFLDEQDYKTAELYLKKALDENIKLGNDVKIQIAKLYLARLKYYKGEIKQAVEEFKDCAIFFKSKNIVEYESMSVGYLMKCYLSLGEVLKTLELSSRSMVLLSQMEFAPKIDSLMQHAKTLDIEAKKKKGGISKSVKLIEDGQSIHQSNNLRIELKSKQAFVKAMTLVTKAEQDSVKHISAIINTTQRLQDSIYNASLNAKYQELEVKYQTLLKTQENEKLTLENTKKELLIETERSKNTKLTVFVSFLILLLAALVVFVKQKRKEMLLKSRLEVVKAKQHEHHIIGNTLHNNKAKDLELIVKKLEQNEAHDLAKQLDDIREDLRQLSHRLTQVPFTEMEFDKQLEALAIKYYEVVEVSVFYKSTMHWKAISDVVKRNLLTVITEGISNAISKDSQAKQITIEFEHTNKRLLVSIADNGNGFDTNMPSTGVGLSNIKMSIAEINGVVSIESIKNKGTNININIVLV